MGSRSKHVRIFVFVPINICISDNAFFIVCGTAYKLWKCNHLYASVKVIFKAVITRINSIEIKRFLLNIQITDWFACKSMIHHGQ